MSGKAPEDLPLDDQPIRQPAPVDPRTQAWYRFVQEIDDLLATGIYTWAESTLRDIQETVERTQQVTPGQQTAVQNIEMAALKRRRRYEGFRRW